MISGTAKLAAVSKVLAGKSLQQNFLADIGETLRVAAIGNRHRHPDNILQRAAGALQCLLEILESLADLSVEVAGERGSRIVDKADVAGEPYRLAAFSDDRRRERVFCFPGRLDDRFLQRHFWSPSFAWTLRTAHGGG